MRNAIITKERRMINACVVPAKESIRAETPLQIITCCYRSLQLLQIVTGRNEEQPQEDAKARLMRPTAAETGQKHKL